jgi:hypothetical protein
MHGSAAKRCLASINPYVNPILLQQPYTMFSTILRLPEDESIYAGHQDHPDYPSVRRCNTQFGV